MNELDEIAIESIYAEGVAVDTMKYCCQLFLDNMKKGSVLELGPAEGLMTGIIYKNKEYFDSWSGGKDYSIVEGSKVFSDSLRKRYPMIKLHNMYFEEFDSNRKYDNIILGHVLEHVDNPLEILSKYKEYLTSGGRILAAVPNANSIHRQAAVRMGLLKSIYDFSEKDKRHGHQRVFDFDSFESIFINSGYRIVKKGGYWLKPLSDGQINNTWSKDMINAFLSLGEKYPDIAGEIYIIAE